MQILNKQTKLDWLTISVIYDLALASLRAVISKPTVLIRLFSSQGSKTRVWSQEWRDRSERKGQEVVRNRLRARGGRRFNLHVKTKLESQYDA